MTVIYISDILSAAFRDMNENDLTTFQGIEGKGMLAEIKKDGKEFLFVADVLGTQTKIEVYSEFDIGLPVQVFIVSSYERA